MKKNRLYTANRWNRPAFMPKDNLFPNGGIMPVQTTGLGNIASHGYGNTGVGLSGDALQGLGKAMGAQSAQNAFNLAKTGSIVGGSGSGLTAGAAIGAGTGILGSVAGSAIGGGYDDGGAGSTIGTLGSTVGGAVGAVNPLLGGAISLGSQVLGGLTQRAFGVKTDQARLNAANQSITELKGFSGNAGSLDDIQVPTATASAAGTYKGGWFSKGKARRKQKALEDALTDARQYAGRAVDNNIDNLVSDQLSDALRNYHAFGGPLFQGMNNDNEMSAINYGFMQDYLTQKKQTAEARNKIGGISPTPAFMNGYAFGGDLQTNGSDFSTGLVTIGAGGTHEENRYDGVQLGVDGHNVPNLVEEGETVYDNYVFSARIPIDQTTKELFHIGKKREMTYADLSKKLEKEIAERVNDPISKTGFKKQMAMLEEQQERQKQEMEAARAREAFESLSPEEQTALMQQKALQEQQAAQEMAIAQQQQSGQQPSPEELAMAEQQQALMADGSQPNLGQEPQMQACGGEINRFDKGGKKVKHSGAFKKDVKDAWGRFTKPGLEAFIGQLEAKLNMAPDEETKDAIRREAMEQLNAIQQGYAGIYRPDNNGSYDFSEAVQNHQDLFNKAYGNTGFGKIADFIDLPNGANTADKAEVWTDGYWGPRTSIRNFGATEYGDEKYYQDLVDRFKSLGLTYAPTIDYGSDGQKLYTLSMPEAAAAAEEKKPTTYWPIDENAAPVASPSASSTKTPKSDKGDGLEVVPVHRAEWPRYAGLLGPAVGLGLMGAGVGRPDTGSIDAAIAGAGDVNLADYQPIGNYLTYRPLDVWYAGNRMSADSRATDRALLNSAGANRGTAMAGLLANGYNNQIAQGNLFRQSQEYNDNLRKQVEEFNRGTDQYNASAYTQNSQFNADARNRARQAAAHLKLSAAAQKAAMDEGWYNSLYGNIGGLFKGIGDLGRENAQRNQVADMAATGIFGSMNPDTFVSNGMLRYETDDEYYKRTGKKRAKGGKMNKNRGLTF